MKKLFFLGLMLTAVFVSNAQFTKAELQATGLTCAMCNNAINKAIQALPFVQSVKSDIKHSSFLITAKEGQELNPDALKDAVEDAGFSVGKLELMGDLSSSKISNDQHITIGKSVYHFINVKDQSINADTRVTVVDKDFVSHKQFKKISASSTMSCVQTGKAGSCCAAEGVASNARVYHVTI